MIDKKEFGDYQTPKEFSDRVCTFLFDKLKIKPKVILEPTCGVGNFLESAKIFDAEQYYGIEINVKYCEECKNKFYDNFNIINANIFDYNIKELTGENDVLIIGNPPWVNNSTLSSLSSNNLPMKKNFKDLKGLDAITGASNFDICEYIILKLLKTYKNTETVISMLCKTSVARNVFKELKRQEIFFDYCNIYNFDSAKVFNISASACMLLIKITKKKTSPEICKIFSFEDSNNEINIIGYRNGKFYSDLKNNVADFDGESCLEWRQGVKHDCSKLMELTIKNGKYINGNKEIVDIEDEKVFPLVKSSMFKKPIIMDFKKYVIVTQKKIKENTDILKELVPKTWKYLDENRDKFNARKSSIYKNSPPFSMFGIGEYSFSRYKVGISGFYKNPLFSILYSEDEKPVMTDDTCYFLSFDNYEYAYAIMLYLNSDRVQSFLKSIAFLDAKRPYTKKILQRIDINKVIDIITLDELKDTEKKLELQPFINNEILENLRKNIIK